MVALNGQAPCQTAVWMITNSFHPSKAIFIYGPSAQE